MSVLDLQDAYHTLPLAKDSQIMVHQHTCISEWGWECHVVQLFGNSLYT